MYRIVPIRDPHTVIHKTRSLAEAVAVALDDDERGILHRGHFVPFHNSVWQMEHPTIKVKKTARQKRKAALGTLAGVRSETRTLVGAR